MMNLIKILTLWITFSIWPYCLVIEMDFRFSRIPALYIFLVLDMCAEALLVIVTLMTPATNDLLLLTSRSLYVLWSVLSCHDCDFGGKFRKRLTDHNVIYFSH
jgi:hypothetical protein